MRGHRAQRQGAHSRLHTAPLLFEAPCISSLLGEEGQAKRAFGRHCAAGSREEEENEARSRVTAPPCACPAARAAMS
jgi:hypothetical protein